MGGGVYCSTTRDYRATTSGYYTKSAGEIFKQRNINNAMNPHGINVRESRDSIEHPKSVAIMLALDLTGSMGSVPHHLVKEGLPSIMDGIIKKGIADPQLLFIGVGDHECDESPLQVGQFESSDELLDKWLTDIYLEGGGGGNAGESYLLAWYFAAKHTSTDCFEKRKEKGFLFTIGDEPTLRRLPAHSLKSIMGEGQYQDYNSSELLDMARETYNVYHLNVCETSSGSRSNVQDEWKQLIGDNLILVKSHRDIPGVISDIVSKGANKQTQNNNSETTHTSKKDSEEVL